MLMHLFSNYVNELNNFFNYGFLFNLNYTQNVKICKFVVHSVIASKKKYISSKYNYAKSS